MTVTPNDRIRKAAVLIATLDRHTADALLAQMSDNDAATVRRVVMELRDEDLECADEVIAEFLGSRPEKSIDVPTPEIVPSHIRDGDSISSSSLNRVPLSSLARRLSSERPQVVAVVVASLAPSRAAALLRHLSEETQTDVLRCIACHDTADKQVLGLIEEQLCADLPNAAAVGQEGISTVEAILRAADGEQRRQLVDRLSAGDESWSRTLTASDCATTRSGNDQSTGQRTAPATADGETAIRMDVEFDDLNQLDDRSLARVFRESDWSTFILALTGAEPTLIDRLVRQMSPRAARTLRQRVDNPGLLRVRDIEVAQQEIAMLIADLAAKGIIRLPRRRGFTIAA